MRFEFPDIADFAENKSPVFPDDIPVDGLFATKESFKRDLNTLMDLAEKTMGLGKSDMRILNAQRKRVIGAAQAYYRKRRARDDLKKDQCYIHLKNDGIYSKKMDTEKLEAHFTTGIKALISGKPKAGLKDYDRATSYDDAMTLSVVREFLGDFINGARKYTGGPDIKVMKVTLHVSKPGDRHHYQTFQDCEETPKLLNLHMDPKPGIMKAIIYLGEVGSDDGPFSYIKGSHRWEYDEVERIFAWGNSVGNYCHSPQHRKVMCSWPKRFRKNAIVGRLIPDGSRLSRDLLKAITEYTSEDANVMVFDPSFGFHRGGLCKSGTRVNLQVVMR
jgi:hypothetical protein